MAAPSVSYRQSYVEKDRCVRNSTAVPVPGVDVYQGFTLSKSEFEHVFLQAAETMDDPSRVSPTATDKDVTKTPTKNKQSTPSRFGRSRKNSNATNLSNPNENSRKHINGRDQLENSFNQITSPTMTSATPKVSDASTGTLSGDGGRRPSSPFRSPPMKAPDPQLFTPEDAADYADVCRKHAASLQRSSPPDYDGAGEFFERACDARATHGLFCSPDNADAHVEYAQNLSKRGLTPEAEYHLRTAADVYRMMNARSARKYGDVLLYLAVVVDRQGRLAEAENFYRSALAVYRANKLSDDNVRVAIDSLSNNLRAQGRADEVDTVVRRHFLGAFD